MKKQRVHYMQILRRKCWCFNRHKLKESRKIGAKLIRLEDWYVPEILLFYLAWIPYVANYFNYYERH